MAMKPMNNRRFSSKSAISSGSIIESNGPQGKIKGNLQQLIERYMSLGKDSFREGDNIIGEKCFQHAEHYRRMLADVPKPIRKNNEETLSLRTAAEESEDAAIINSTPPSEPPVTKTPPRREKSKPSPSEV
jgi:hypothetical protein